MSPKIVDKEEKRRSILSAALRVFARQGYGRTTMEEVAKAAGIGKGTIYEYFTHKDDLFFAVYEQARNAFHETIYREAERQETATGALTAFVAATLTALGQWQEFGFVLLDFWAEHRRGAAVDLRFSDIYAFSREHIAGFIKKGIKSGEFRKVDPALAASALIAALDGLLLQRIFDPATLSRRGEISRMTDLILGGIRA